MLIKSFRTPLMMERSTQRELTHMGKEKKELCTAQTAITEVREKTRQFSGKAEVKAVTPTELCWAKSGGQRAPIERGRKRGGNPNCLLIGTI